MHTPPPTTTDPNPIPAPSQLTVSRHAPTRVRVLNVRSSLLFHEASPQTALSICTLSARRRHRRRWNLRWARLWRATPRCTLPPPCPLISQGRTLHSHNAQCQTPLYLHHPSVLSTCSSTPSSPRLPLRPLAFACTLSALSPPTSLRVHSLRALLPAFRARSSGPRRLLGVLRPPHPPNQPRAH